MNKGLKWKVCGMRSDENIAEVISLEPDFMGFIFYPQSPRFVGNDLNEKQLISFPSKIKKVAVVVNQNKEFVLRSIHKYKMDYVQLHGSESADDCMFFKDNGLGVIKAFLIGESFNFDELTPYLSVVDYFLFDTKADGGHGGHGFAFNWEVLQKYPFGVPYFLAGGIDLDNLSDVGRLSRTHLAVLDINSRFEIKKAVKSVDKLKQFKEQLNKINNNSL